MNTSEGGGSTTTAESDYVSVIKTDIEIQWRRLFRGGVGGILFAVFEGIVSIPLGVAQAFSSLGAGVEASVRRIFMALVSLGPNAVRAAGADIAQYGIFAQLVSVVAVLTTLFVLAWGVSQWLT